MESSTVKEATALQDTGSIYIQVAKAAPLELIYQIREGVPVTDFVKVSQDMGLSKDKVSELLHFTRSTINRRLKGQGPLPADYSERILGLQKIIGLVEIMVKQSGDASGFDAAQWVAQWLEQPVAALGNAKPAEFMDTVAGQALVTSLLTQMQSGAYA